MGLDDYFAELFTPDQSDSIASRMAILQGNPADTPFADPAARDKSLGVPGSVPFIQRPQQDDPALYGPPDEDEARRLGGTRLAGPLPAGGGAPSFADRFQPAVDNPLQRLGGGGPIPVPTQSITPPMADVPMPQPRPDMTARLGGGGASPIMVPPQAPPAMAPPPAAAPMGLPPGAPDAMAQGKAPQDFMARLRGVLSDPLNRGAQEPDASGAKGILGRLAGLDAPGEKRFASAIAAGFKGGNPAFAGGAFMNGASGAATGGLKSDKEDTEAATASAEKDQKQKNFDRTQGDKEQTSKALRALYGQRGDALKENADTRAANPPGSRGRNAWNKPPHERYKDAMKLIQDEGKAIFGRVNPMGSRDDVAKQRADAQQQLDAFKKNTLKTYGIDENGQETSPDQPGGVPSATPSQGSGGMRGGGTYQDPHIPTTQQEFEKIPPGSFFINPSDGEILRKKGAKTSALDDETDSEAA